MNIKGSFVIAVAVFLAVSSVSVPAMAKKNAIPNLSGSWIGALCTKEALPVGALVTNLGKDSLRSLSGPVAIGIPGLEVVNLSDLQLTIAENGGIHAVAKGTFEVADDRVFQAQFSFNGDYLDTGAIIADGTLHLSGPTEKMTSDEIRNYVVRPDLTGWTPPGTFPPKEDIDLNNLNQTIINTTLGNYFGGQDMGSYTLSQDLATHFGGQDMGSYTLSQGAATYFPGIDLSASFGGQDMGTYLAKTYLRRFILKDGFVLNVELSRGGALDFVLILIPKQ